VYKSLCLCWSQTRAITLTRRSYEVENDPGHVEMVQTVLGRCLEREDLCNEFYLQARVCVYSSCLVLCSSPFEALSAMPSCSHSSSYLSLSFTLFIALIHPPYLSLAHGAAD
jgi:hypothetical protein